MNSIRPGPAMTYVVARTIAGGRPERLASCFDTAAGGLLHVLAAALGLSMLVARSAMAFSLLKYVGAGYLVYLGLRMLLRQQQDLVVKPVAAQGARRAFVESIVVEALNVKTALFFLAFLPQFAATRLLASGAARQARARLLARISGGTLIGLRASLAFARRAS